MISSPDPRSELCRSLGISSEREVYALIVSARQSGIGALQRKGLTANNLMRLGYDYAGMKRLGFDDAALQKLGYALPASSAPAPAPVALLSSSPTASHDPGVATTIRELILSGARAPKLKELGYTLSECRKANFTPADLSAIGYELGELATVFSCGEMRRAGFGPKELRYNFNGHEMRAAGFSATDMRVAGFSIRELINFGYPENHIITAGFTIIELSREGLSRFTVDKRSLGE